MVLNKNLVHEVLRQIREQVLINHKFIMTIEQKNAYIRKLRAQFPKNTEKDEKPKDEEKLSSEVQAKKVFASG